MFLGQKIGCPSNDRNNIISGEAVEIGFLRRVHGVTFPDKVGSCEIPRTLNVEPVLRIEKAQIYWFGHVSRIPH